MSDPTACEIIRASGQASAMKQNFICAQDMIHTALLSSPWPVLFYAAGVLFVMFLVHRAAKIPPPRTSPQEKEAGKSPPS